MTIATYTPEIHKMSWSEWVLKRHVFLFLVFQLYHSKFGFWNLLMVQVMVKIVNIRLRLFWPKFWLLVLSKALICGSAVRFNQSKLGQLDSIWKLQVIRNYYLKSFTAWRYKILQWIDKSAVWGLQLRRKNKSKENILNLLKNCSYSGPI